MAYTIRYDDESDYLMVVVDGILNLALLKSMASDVATAVAEHGCKRILNDLRGARLKGVIDIIQMPSAARTSGIDLRSKRALVVGEDSPGFDFLETVFVNRSHRVKMFTSIDEARRWLLKD